MSEIRDLSALESGWMGWMEQDGWDGMGWMGWMIYGLLLCFVLVFFGGLLFYQVHR